MNKPLSTALKKLTKHLPGQILIVALLGAIQVFAFAPFSQWWVLYPSIVALLILFITQKIKTNRLFLLSFIFNSAMFVATIHWVYVSMDLFGGMPAYVSVLLILLLCAYLAIFPSLALWLSFRIKTTSKTMQLLLLLPALWLTMDWLRGWFLTGFPWAYLGYSHADTPLVGIAPVLGVQGITLAIILICSSFTLLLLKQSRVIALVSITLLLLAGQLLKGLTYTKAEDEIAVSLVQGNIDQNKKWLPEELYPSLFKYLDLSESKQNETRENELIIWPESAVAALELDMQQFLQPLSRKLKKQNKALLTGIINYDLRKDEYFNTIIMLGSLPKGQGYAQTSPNRYKKHHLLPIGEFVPFEEFLRPLAPYFNLPMSSFHRGEEIQTNLQITQTALAPALCYEIAFPELLRQNVDNNTGVLLTLSNDAWFGRSIGPDQHLQIARMRAIELARPLLRSTNTGITAIYNSKGEELGRLPSYTEGVLRSTIQPRTGNTPYQLIGQWPLWGFCIISFVTIFLSNRRNNQKSASENKNQNISI